MSMKLLRDTTDSEKINLLSPQAEVFFYRLMMKADDYGNYYANPKLVRANLYPLRLDSVREADIARWMTECQKAGLLVFYTHESKPFVSIGNFGQKKRHMKRKFPPSKSDEFKLSPGRHEPPPDIDIDTEVDIDTETEVESPPPPDLENVSKAKESKENKLAARKEKFIAEVETFRLYTPEMRKDFCDYWTEHNRDGSRMRFEKETFFDLGKRLGTWARNEVKFSKGTPPPQQGQVYKKPEPINYDEQSRRLLEKAKK